MEDCVVLHGIVLRSGDVGEYDKRLVILTKERGRITAFASGARRPKSLLRAGCVMFVYGEFTLYPMKDAYKVNSVEIENAFYQLSGDIQTACYASYFAEVAEYFTQENVACVQVLKLLYQSFRALLSDKIPNRLVRCIFEMKMLVLDGTYPQMFQCIHCGIEQVKYFSALKNGMFCEKCGKETGDFTVLNTSTIYAFQYIISAQISKLYTFVVKEEVLAEMEFVLRRYYQLHVEKDFNSLEILKVCGEK